MRLIFTILLIGLLKADAQIVINASSPYRPMVSLNLLLDDYPNAAAAYSLRKLRNAYTGAAIRVRKDTTGQPEQDINFTANGDLDTASLKSFLNARNGFVTTWYDQSGQGRNATQTIQANQPRIANLGVVDRRNTKVTLVLDGTNDELRADDVATTITGEDKAWTKICVASKTNTNTAGNLLSFTNLSNNNPLIVTSLNASAQYSITIRQTSSPTPAVDASSGTYAANTQYLIFNYSTGLFFELFSNNSSIMSSAYNTGTITLNAFTIGAIRRTTTSSWLGGNFQEVVIYSTDQSTNRTGMQTNINSFYSIY